MNQKPLLSVIIANYNTAPYLRACLDSVAGQTYEPLEIVIYDDCSTDASVDVIRNYEKKYPSLPRRVKAIFGQVNKGVAAARHQAILQAEGEYITTLDSDDYYYELQKLEKEMDLILRYKKEQNKDIIAFSDIILVKTDGTAIGPQWQPHTIKQGNIFNEILSRSAMIPRDFIMKREAYFKAGGYDHKLVIFEDWDLKIRLAHDYEYYFTGAVGIAYRRHGSGLSSSPYRERIASLDKVFYKNLHLAGSKAQQEVLKKEFSHFMKDRDRVFFRDLERQGFSFLQKLNQLGFAKLYPYLAHSVRIFFQPQMNADLRKTSTRI